jgi:hypothetical protein
VRLTAENLVFGSISGTEIAIFRADPVARGVEIGIGRGRRDGHEGTKKNDAARGGVVRES